MSRKIHIGNLIRRRAEELDIMPERLAERMNISSVEVKEIFKKESLDTELLLKVSKRLNYDFFRIYTNHLIMYAPNAAISGEKRRSDVSRQSNGGFDFRKNVYTPEVIAWFLEKIESGALSVRDVIEKYNIPKTTIYRWCRKYGKEAE